MKELEKTAYKREYMYYSKVLNKVFDTYKELCEAEQKWEKENEAKIKAQELRKEKFKKVEDSYKKYHEAYEEYCKLANAFIEEFGSLHMTYNKTNSPKSNILHDLLLELFK